MLDGYEIHPLAAIFPMLSEEELADLAADIKENGLLHPIVRTLDGIVVDGRNRLAACEIAGVEPEFEDRIVDDDDARALIVSANLQRRNLSKGQQAMAHAMLFPEPVRYKRGGSNSSVTKELGITLARLSLARAVLRHDPDLADAVLRGRGETLDHAYEIIKQRQQEASSAEARSVRLREMAPDLADLVSEERMTLGEALAAAAQRAEQRRIAIEHARRASENLLNLCTAAVTIAGGYELGERGLVTAEQLTQLDNAMDLLKRLYREEAHAGE